MERTERTKQTGLLAEMKVMFCYMWGFLSPEYLMYFVVTMLQRGRFLRSSAAEWQLRV